mmetsp:Transcript_105861/g.309655  ORF Transcript_105861/g.309655 Transcript_105861/m.309655 type:complete len:272 (-) Transcript_105861:73-888(-)
MPAMVEKLAWSFACCCSARRRPLRDLPLQPPFEEFMDFGMGETKSAGTKLPQDLRILQPYGMRGGLPVKTTYPHPDCLSKPLLEELHGGLVLVRCTMETSDAATNKQMVVAGKMQQEASREVLMSPCSVDTEAGDYTSLTKTTGTSELPELGMQEVALSPCSIATEMETFEAPVVSLVLESPWNSEQDPTAAGMEFMEASTAGPWMLARPPARRELRLGEKEPLDSEQVMARLEALEAGGMTSLPTTEEQQRQQQRQQDGKQEQQLLQDAN